MKKAAAVVHKSDLLERVKLWHVFVGWVALCVLARFGPDLWRDLVEFLGALWGTIVGVYRWAFTL